MTTDVTDAAHRVTAFLRARGRMLGLDPDEIAAAASGSDPDPSPLLVADLAALAEHAKPGRRIVMFVPVVSEPYGDGPPALRSVWPTFAEAKHEIDTERARFGHEPLTWTDEFDGANATGPTPGALLRYDIQPVSAVLP